MPACTANEPEGTGVRTHQGQFSRTHEMFSPYSSRRFTRTHEPLEPYSLKVLEVSARFRLAPRSASSDFPERSTPRKTGLLIVDFSPLP